MSDKTYPIILAHGIARFDIISQQVFKLANMEPHDGLHYFRNIRTHLQSHGFRVQHTDVEWAENVDVRAQSLKRQLEQLIVQEALSPQRVHIIAHSMGGLDARHMLFNFRNEALHKKVATLTTIATPHHGSPVADSVVGKAGDTLAVMGIGKGAQDLTTQACTAFNEKSSAWERECGVRFRTYAGKQDYRYIFDFLKPTWRIIHELEGDNDGLVSIESAKWKQEYFVGPVLDADHFNLCGWWDLAEIRRGITPSTMERDIRRVYLGIAQELAEEYPTNT